MQWEPQIVTVSIPTPTPGWDLESANSLMASSNFQRCEKITIPSHLTSTTRKSHIFAAQIGAELPNWKPCDWKCLTLFLRCSRHYLVYTVQKPIRNLSTFWCLARELYGRPGAHLLLVVATRTPSKEQMSPAVGHRARISPRTPRCGTSLTPSAACQNHHTNETYPAHSRQSREQTSARRCLQVEKVNISLWGPVACFWTWCSILAQAGVPLLDFSAARGVAFPNLCAVPAWKSPGKGFQMSSWRVLGWPFGHYFHLHSSHMPAVYYWLCKSCCWLRLTGNRVGLESIF